MRRGVPPRLVASLLAGIASLAILLAANGSAAQPAPGTVTEELAALASELELARFETVRVGADALLERSDLAAAERVRALELRAIAEVALRREGDARETLRELYRRDPGHRLAEISGPGSKNGKRNTRSCARGLRKTSKRH